MNIVEKIANWQFLDEELYRWFIFFGALICISIAWGGVLRFMRNVG